MINEELNILLQIDDNDELLDFINSEEGRTCGEKIQIHLNQLQQLKTNVDTIILNDKIFDNYIQNDIFNTKKIIKFIAENGENELDTNREEIEPKKEGEENLDVDNEIEQLNQEFQNLEKESIELVGKYVKLLETRDKCTKIGRKDTLIYKRGLKSYSSKLLNIYQKEEKMSEITKEGIKNKCSCYFVSNDKCCIF